MRQKARAERAALEAAVAELRTAAVSIDQLATLQARVEGLHGAALLSDDELGALEDLIMDASDLRQSMAPEIGRPCLRPSSASIGWCLPHRPSGPMPASRGSCAADGSAVEAAAAAYDRQQQCRHPVGLIVAFKGSDYFVGLVECKKLVLLTKNKIKKHFD